MSVPTPTTTRLAHPLRRALLTGIAAGCVALPTLALAQPAGAAPTSAATSTGAETSAHGTPGVTASAWASGRAAHGTGATAHQAVTSYWTAARMKDARPVEESPSFQKALRRHEQTKGTESARQKARNESGSPESVAAHPGSLAGSDRSARAPRAGGVDDFAINPNLPYNAPTARTSGKVFFTMNGSNYQCSGTVVNSEGLDTVWTAGHCVHPGSGGAWASNWQFVPAYNSAASNPRPYGTWTANQLWTSGEWFSDSDFTGDMGVAVMGTLNGNHIVSLLGGQGLRVNIGKNVAENAFGYPSEAPFTGGRLFRCAGNSSPEWTVLWVTSDTIKIPCDMTRGSSGGAWLNGWDGNWGYLNGVNSRIDRIVGPTIMLSPYFDNTAWNLYNATRNL